MQSTCSQSEKGETAFNWYDQEGLPGGGEVLGWREVEFLSMKRAH